MAALTERPRLRRLLERSARFLEAAGFEPRRQSGSESLPSFEEHALDRPPKPEPATEPEPATAPEPATDTETLVSQAREFARELGPGAFAVDRDPVSCLLYHRLADDEVEEVEREISEDPLLSGDFQTAATPELRRFLSLSFGMWLRVPGVSRSTRLRAEQPPEEVHAMARGPLAAAGGLYEADLVVDALANADIDVTTSIRGTSIRGLDFGCSSGRVVRVLAAAYPSIRWSACDPNEPAINWAAQHLPGIEFFVNGQTPPLPLADASLDIVYAISIWSHFEPSFGLRWFDEMHRVLRRGGHLVCTTHGLTSVAFYATNNLRTPEQCREIAGALYRAGWWYAAEFGEEGDWGVVNPDWGTAFISPEWLLAQLCPRWRVLEFVPGRNQSNQDVYVLQRA